MKRQYVWKLLRFFAQKVTEGFVGGVFAMLLFALLAPPAFAVEKGWQIELPRRMTTTGKQMLTNYSQTLQQAQKTETEIALIKERLFASENEDENSALKKQYVDYRAGNVDVWSRYTINCIAGTESLLNDMTVYEKRLKEATASGFGDGVSPNDVNVATDIANSLEGMGTIVNMVTQVNPDSNVSNLVTSLRTLDQLAGDHFTGRMNPSLESQKELIIGFLVAAKAVKRLLAQEASLLRLKLYTIDAQNIVRVFGELGDVLPNGLGGIVDSINNARQTDDKVIGFGISNTSVASGGSMAGSVKLGAWRKELKAN